MNAASHDSTDQALIAACLDGDAAAFECLYRRHHARIYALCWRLCGSDAHWAEDVLQETFVQAWRKLADFRGTAALTTWLHRLAVNIVLAERRRGSARLRQCSDVELSANSAVTAAETHADHDLEAAIANLPQRARLVLVLHELHGYSHVEIGHMSNMASGTSRAHLHRARQLLKQALHKDVTGTCAQQEVHQHV